MKKNIAMRVAAFLFILTMISTCAFATTFAKYTTSGSTEDTARVAKWGVTVTAAAEETLFEDTYDGTVISAVTDEDVVAPGTEGTLASFEVDGTPEVKAQVTYVATLTLEGWTVKDAAGKDYCPVEITVDGTTYKYSDYDNLAGFIAAVEGAIEAYGATYNANETIDDTLDITWEWAYSVDDAHDKLDTALGDLATAPTIKLEVTATVTQLD